MPLLGGGDGALTDVVLLGRSPAYPGGRGAASLMITRSCGGSGLLRTTRSPSVSGPVERCAASPCCRRRPSAPCGRTGRPSPRCPAPAAPARHPRRGGGGRRCRGSGIRPGSAPRRGRGWCCCASKALSTKSIRPSREKLVSSSSRSCTRAPPARSPPCAALHGLAQVVGFAGVEADIDRVQRQQRGQQGLALLDQVAGIDAAALTRPGRGRDLGEFEVELRPRARRGRR